jgi:hypothetical protein
MPKLYYSQRTGLRPSAVTLPQLKRVLRDLYRRWTTKGMFQQWFGYDCIDSPYPVDGLAGDPGAFFYRLTRNENLWPVEENIDQWTEADLFEAIEVLHDHASVGAGGYPHGYDNQCGPHFSTFNQNAGQRAVRDDFNALLALYGSGYELTAEGQVADLLRPEVMDLIRTQTPSQTPVPVTTHLSSAIRLYRQRNAPLDDQRTAVRELADALEYLRPQLVGKLPSKDDDMLFTIANNFALRHSNPQQIRGYDPSWCRWMFEVFLSTLHQCFTLLGWSQMAGRAEGDGLPIPDPLPDVARGFDPDEIPF